jgi:D-glycero-D-manno-heptose 1,7-bisphosphate phosphatase
VSQPPAAVRAISRHRDKGMRQMLKRPLTSEEIARDLADGSPQVSAAGTHDIGLYAERLSTATFSGRPCLFLDRDGVIVEETHYLHRVQDIVLIPGVAEAIALANRAGIAVVMVTNQAGIGRGLYGWKEFAMVQGAILARLAEDSGARFDMALACAYHADGLGAYAAAHHPWRKPNPGMIAEAAQALGIDLSKSMIVGDKLTDVAAGLNARLPRGALVLTGHGQREVAEARDSFARWHAEGRFRPSVAESAAHAIRDWVSEFGLPRDPA